MARSSRDLKQQLPVDGNYTDPMTTSPIILLHAFPLSPEMFDDLRAELKILIHTPALPGFGDVPLSQERPSMGAIARSVLAYADAHGLSKFIVGGVSLGGYVAMELMRIAPERLTAAILIDTKAEDDEPASKTNRERIARLALRSGIDSLRGAMLPPLTGRRTKVERPKVVERVAEIFNKANPEAITWTQRAMAARPNSIPTLQKFLAPLLVMVGAEDEISPVADAQRMAEAAPKGEMAVIDGAGHLAVMEQAAACADAIRSWVMKL